MVPDKIQGIQNDLSRNFSRAEAETMKLDRLSYDYTAEMKQKLSFLACLLIHQKREPSALWTNGDR